MSVIAWHFQHIWISRISFPVQQTRLMNLPELSYIPASTCWIISITLTFWKANGSISIIPSSSDIPLIGCKMTRSAIHKRSKSISFGNSQETQWLNYSYPVLVENFRKRKLSSSRVDQDFMRRETRILINFQWWITGLPTHCPSSWHQSIWSAIGSIEGSNSQTFCWKLHGRVKKPGHYPNSIFCI